MTPADAHALAMAEQTGADGIYSGDWRKALRDAAATWTAEGATRPSGLTGTGQNALYRLEINHGLLDTTATDTADDTATGFVPAWHCDHADLTLRWNQHRLSWELRQHGRPIAALDGYPTGHPARTDRDALAWADSITGPQQWIPRPARSGTHHTHATPNTPCTPSRTDAAAAGRSAA